MDIETDVIEYALAAWIVISIAAFIIQLIRRRRYQRSVGTDRAPQTAASASQDAPTIQRPSSATSDVATPSATLKKGVKTKTKTASEASAIKASTDETPAATAPKSVDTPETEPQPDADSADSADVDLNEQDPSVIDLGGEDAAVPKLATISDLLGGVRLPANLLPLDTGQTDYAVRFSTSGHAPADVGTALADELERLGYQIVPKAEDQAMAIRENEALSLMIHDLEGDKVEVDVWVGEDDNPFDPSSAAAKATAEALGK